MPVKEACKAQKSKLIVNSFLVFDSLLAFFFSRLFVNFSILQLLPRDHLDSVLKKSMREDEFVKKV